MEKRRVRQVSLTMFMGILLLFFWFSLAAAEEYEAMERVGSANVFFDMRDGNPELAAVHMKLMHSTFKELTEMGKTPDFVVVFMGPSVRLISSDRREFSANEQVHLDEIAQTVIDMAKDGIRFEVCLAALDYFSIDPDTIQEEFKQVGNGWISAIGYQARNYRLVPVY